MESLGFLGLVFDTGLSVTPLMGHLGSLASHWSVPVLYSNEIIAPPIIEQIDDTITIKILLFPPAC